MKIKKLRAFDLDDTLFETESKVILKKSNGEVIELTPAEYALYEPETGDTFDFSQFAKVINPTLIRPVAKRFYKIVSAGTDNRSYVILTARGSEAIPHIKEIIRKYFNVDIDVVALGDGNPQAKADWILNKINNEGYNDIFFVDDSSKNIITTYRTIKDLPIKYKLVDLSTPRKYEADNLQQIKLKEIIKKYIYNYKGLNNIL